MAINADTFAGISGAVSDLFAAKAYKFKAQGSAFEQKNYLLASDLATENEKFAEASTSIKETQIDRESYKSLGTTQADVAGAGFAASGSALDLMRDSAMQGAVTHQVAAAQGLINEAGYTEQAQSYQNMASAAQVAINADNEAAKLAKITAPLKIAGAIFGIFNGGSGGGGGGGGGGDGGGGGGGGEE